MELGLNRLKRYVERFVRVQLLKRRGKRGTIVEDDF